MTLSRKQLEAALRIAKTAKEGGRTYASKEHCEEVTNTVITALELLLNPEVVVMPVEPTDEMILEAVVTACPDLDGGDEYYPFKSYEVPHSYTAMISTSPYKLTDEVAK